MDGVESHAVDEFDRYQLENVIEICQKSANLFEASQQFFAVSKAKNNVVTM